MKIVVIGGSGRIGEKLVFNLRQDDYRVLEGSPSFGVDAVTGEGLDQALEGAQVLVDVSNSPQLDGEAAMRFFETAGRRLTAAARAAGVQHQIALSIVGTDRLQASGYFRAKKVQEDLIKASGLPYSLLRSTQFFEFIAGVVQNGSGGDVVISPARVQPISGEEVAQALADLATGEPINGTVEVAGPQRLRLSDLAVEVLTAYEDTRRIIVDPEAPYFGARLDDQSLLPGADAHIAVLRFEDWLRESLQPGGAAFQARRTGVSA
ncbi:MAG: SDR family oxidoreductase [Pseudomonadota bacterium]